MEKYLDEFVMKKDGKHLRDIYEAVVAAGELIVRLKEAVVLLRQHLGGLGVPAVGMAFPGYVGQPNGMGYSEMTWLPVLAGAAGALGAAGLGAPYPYITMVGFSF
ncbi:hypothetical protein SSX86_016264 [Deinandra increscens subsp. villosa]|uniref:Uncharacterized protein n=1 Tax=Deinandra increscens subsp. villosa TaxID=3103831 RepID=A0AAP0D2D6_9ASTR